MNSVFKNQPWGGAEVFVVLFEKQAELGASYTFFGVHLSICDSLVSEREGECFLPLTRRVFRAFAFG